MCCQVKWNTDDTDVDNDVKQGVNSNEQEDINHMVLQPQRDSVVDEETVPARHHAALQPQRDSAVEEETVPARHHAALQPQRDSAVDEETVPARHHVALQPQRDSVVNEETVPARHHCCCDRSSTCCTAGDQRNIILSTTACQVSYPVY